MLTVKTPSAYKPERAYIIRVLLGEFLGIPHRIEYGDRADVSLSLDDAKELILPDILFRTPKEQWLTGESLPDRPLKILRIDGVRPGPAGRGTPVLFGAGPLMIADRTHLPIDVFGGAFFMLTRYEEMVKKERDAHDRFPASASLAFQEGFLDRPIVNEHLEILWFYLKRLWPALTRKKRAFRIFPTHDLDQPFQILFRSFGKTAVKMGGDLLKRRDPRAGVRTFRTWRRIRRGAAADPFDSFERIMDWSEQAGLRSAFYFMAGGRTEFDNPYPLAHPAMRRLIRRIIERGHEPGFHPSYDASSDRNRWRSEHHRLCAALDGREIKGGRQHYLRFRTPGLWRRWAEVGARYDASVGFADHAGFRSGVCYPHPVFDLEKRAPIPLVERPLIVMDGTIIQDQYMGLGVGSEALRVIETLKNNCKLFDGEFTLLWHNHLLIEPDAVELYKRAITP